MLVSPVTHCSKDLQLEVGTGEATAAVAAPTEVVVDATAVVDVTVVLEATSYVHQTCRENPPAHPRERFERVRRQAPSNPENDTYELTLSSKTPDRKTSFQGRIARRHGRTAVAETVRHFQLRV